jgi:hypothetical protein
MNKPSESFSTNVSIGDFLSINEYNNDLAWLRGIPNATASSLTRIPNIMLKQKLKKKKGKKKKEGK